MGIHRPPSVEEQPFVEMSRWTIYEVPHKTGVTRHAVGFIGVEGQGRVCSAIQHFDGTNTFVTRSGRKYKLVGPSGWDADASYVWDLWCRFNDIDPSISKDVTREYETPDRS